MKVEVIVDKEVCKGCLICASVCPKQVFEPSQHTNSRGYAYVVPANSDSCIGCTQCTIMCPDAAITLERRD